MTSNALNSDCNALSFAISLTGLESLPNMLAKNVGVLVAETRESKITLLEQNHTRNLILEMRMGM
jgi:hypothetical protein